MDIEVLATWCAGLDADVLALQEVDVGLPRSGGVDTVAAVAEASGGEAFFAPALEIDGGRYGNALIVKGSLHETEVIRLERVRGDERRSLGLARVQLSAGEVTIGFTHLAVNPFSARRQLRAAAAAAAQRGSPTILLGDFNLDGFDARRVLQRANSPLELCGPMAPSFPAARPLRRIDHICVGGLSAGPTEPLARAPVSDHLAVRCRLTLAAK